MTLKCTKSAAANREQSTLAKHSGNEMMKVKPCLLFALVVAFVSVDADGAKGKKANAAKTFYYMVKRSAHLYGQCLTDRAKYKYPVPVTMSARIYYIVYFQCT